MNDPITPPPDVADLRYRMHLAALKGNIWDDLETLDPQEYHGLSDAFAAGAAKAMGITKRTGWPTRIIFVCEPNGRMSDRIGCGSPPSDGSAAEIT